MFARCRWTVCSLSISHRVVDSGLGHVIADPRTGTVRQPFALCFHARPLSGSPGGDQVETSDARWFTTGDIGALPIRPATRKRIGHALTPGRACHIG
jgi:8-oxo-dGTP diphosphatase